MKKNNSTTEAAISLGERSREPMTAEAKSRWVAEMRSTSRSDLVDTIAVMSTEGSTSRQVKALREATLAYVQTRTMTELSKAADRLMYASIALAVVAIVVAVVGIWVG